jgi:predicted enzyme related to lactoylglutathione lyase
MFKVIEFAFVGYPVTDMTRARAFYEGVLNLKPASTFDDGHWVEYEVGPHTLALSNVSDEWKPSKDGGGVALEVEDFDAAIAWLQSKGVTFTLPPTESPVCHLALISDPDGNSICIHKRKVHAAR